MKLPSPKVRQWIYNVLNAALLVLVGYGVLNDQEVALWLLLLNAALGMAAAKVPSAPDAQRIAD
jgi:hypothetical protein